jgi:branched-subunit amino acid transport protein
MDVREGVLWVIIGTGLVTVTPRVLPLVVLSRITLPGWLIRWLGYVPIAVLAALLAQSVAVQDGQIALSAGNLALVAIVPTLVVAVWTRSLMGTLLSGIVVMALLRWAVG